MKRTGSLARAQRSGAAGALLVCAALLAGCAASSTLPGPDQNGSRVIGRGNGVLVVVPGPRDSLRTLAARYLGDSGLHWQIADANGIGALSPAREVVVPLTPHNPSGVYDDGYQVVPILNYHRFDNSGNRLSVQPEMFRRHLQYLVENDYRVVPLAQVLEFLRGERPLPMRALAITIDDGYRSTYDVAYPLLVEFGFPATVFVYSDFVGRGGMSYEQLREMRGSGLIDIQAHSKSHANLTEQLPDETQAAYRRRIEREIEDPAERLSSKLGDRVTQYAYPYGDANTYVMERLRANGYQMGLTVSRGPNAFFAHPYAVRRSMVFSDRGMQGFVAALRTFEQAALR